MSLRFAGGLFHVVRRAGSPMKAFADEPLRDEANGRRLVLSAGGGRGVVNEKQVEVEGVNRDVAGGGREEFGEQVEGRFAARVQRKPLNDRRLRASAKTGVFQKEMPHPLTDPQ